MSNNFNRVHRAVPPAACGVPGLDDLKVRTEEAVDAKLAAGRALAITRLETKPSDSGGWPRSAASAGPAPEVALEVPPHGMDVVGVILRVVVFDEEGGRLHAVVVRLAAARAAGPGEVQALRPALRNCSSRASASCSGTLRA